MDTETHELYLRWINEMWSGGAHAGELVADTFIGHLPDRRVTGPRELQKVVDETRAMFTSVTFSIEQGPYVDGDIVVGRWRGRGTAADGTRSELVGHDILRTHRGEFVEYWAVSAPAS